MSVDDGVGDGDLLASISMESLEASSASLRAISGFVAGDTLPLPLSWSATSSTLFLKLAGLKLTLWACRGLSLME